MKSYVFTLLCLMLVALSGCDLGPKSGYGFTLPEGDAGRGALAFTELQCNACHTVEGYADIVQPDGAELSISLGGAVTHIETYGELVTSIINPSHRISRVFPEGMAKKGESPMRALNEVMTVSQLTDLVMFLQSHYELVPYDRTMYRLYP